MDAPEGAYWRFYGGVFILVGSDDDRAGLSGRGDG